MSRPRPRTDARREELIAAARRVVERSGFAAATVGQITREAGASLGLLNYHFDGKDAVLAAAFEDLARQDLGDLQAIAELPDPPPARLAAYLESSGWADQDGWRTWVDAWGEAVRSDVLRATIDRFAEGWRASLALVLEDGVADGSWECPDPFDAAARLVAVIDGVGLHTTLHPRHVTPTRATAWARRIAELELGVALPDAPPPPERRPATALEARLPIRGRDLDPDGRVHAAVHVSFLEEARARWLASRLGPDAQGLELVAVTMEFERPLRAADEEAVVRCVLDRAAGSTARTRETITTRAGAPVTEARATLVARDTNGRLRELEDAELEALGA